RVAQRSHARALANNGRCATFTSPRRHRPWRLGHPEPRLRRRRRWPRQSCHPRRAECRPPAVRLRVARAYASPGRPAPPSPRTPCSDAGSKARCAPCPRRPRSSRIGCCRACGASRRGRCCREWRWPCPSCSSPTPPPRPPLLFWLPRVQWAVHTALSEVGTALAARWLPLLPKRWQGWKRVLFWSASSSVSSHICCRLAPKVFRIGFSEQRINCRARAAHAGTSFLCSHLAAASLSVMTVQPAPRLCDRRVAEQRGVLPCYAHTRAAATWPLRTRRGHGERVPSRRQIMSGGT